MTTVIDAVKQHSRFGGSIADRYMNCPGSVALCGTVPSKPSGAYAVEGTAAHFVAEQCLKTQVPAKDFLDYAYHVVGQPPVIVSGNMIDAVQVYLDAVNAELGDDGELYVEQGFEIVSEAAPGEVWGTNDAMVFHPSTGRLRVFDYKHGVGISVSADDNKQLKFYAAGAVFSHADWRISEVVLTIVQPRARDADDVGAVKDWTFDVLDLLEFQGELEVAIAKAKTAAPFLEHYDRNGYRDYLKTGSWCRWCDAASVCPAKDAQAVAATTLDFEGVKSVTEITAASLPDPKTFDGERLAKVVAALDILSAWANQAQEYLEALILGGHDVPGWKAVDKIGRAKWIDDPNQIVAYAGMVFDLEADQLMPPHIITIGDAEKLLKAAGATKAQIDTFKLKFTIKESSGLTVAPASDRRPAVNAVASNFGTVNTAALAAE